MLQVKKYANYFHLLTYTNSTLYALTYNYFNYNLTHLTDFNTCNRKKGCGLHSQHPSTLKYYEKTTYFTISFLMIKTFESIRCKILVL